MRHRPPTDTSPPPPPSGQPVRDEFERWRRLVEGLKGDLETEAYEAEQARTERDQLKDRVKALEDALRPFAAQACLHVGDEYRRAFDVLNIEGSK